ncbi:MAG: hypothetical protein PHU71_04480 [Candidatus Gracilibacteria bacterium]|nr:hypothetical protein [Candidatus Gracilibacteria bacterium]
MNSLSLAQIIGPFFLVAGLGILIGSKHFMVVVQEMMKSPAILFLTGFMTFLLGLILVSLHNVWVADWTVIITILAWASLLKGATMLLFPTWMEKIASYFMKSAYITLGGVIWFVAGLWMCYMVWM